MPLARLTGDAILCRDDPALPRSRPGGTPFLIAALTVIPQLSLALVAWLAALSAPEKIRFDPARDLPGYETVRASPDKDYYPLESFEVLLGEEMQPEELAAVRKRWADERGAVDAKFAALAADPRAACLFRLQFRLGQHAFFSKVGWTLEELPAPFALIVQRPSKDDPKHAAAMVELYRPWLALLAAQFDARIAGPAKCAPRADHGAVVLAVLATPGDFQTASRFLEYGMSSVAGGYYDGKLTLGVGRDDPFGGSKSARIRVRPLLIAACVGLLHRHHADATQPKSVLVKVGMPAYLFETLGDGKTVADAPKPPTALLMNLTEVLSDSKKRLECAIRLPQLLPLSHDSEAIGLADRQARGVGQTDLSDRRAYWDFFNEQCQLWTHFLFDGDGGAHRERWLRFVQLVMSGKDAVEAARVAFEGQDLRALEQAFWSWCVAEMQRVFPTSQVPPDAIEDLLAERQAPLAAAAASAGPARVATPTAAPVEPPFDPKLFDVGVGDFDARIGLGLVRARDGDLDSALAQMQELAALSPAAPYEGRVRREVERLTAAIRLRDQWLAGLAAKSGRLEIEIEGKKVNAPVARVENGTIVFAANKQGATTLPVASLDPADVVRLTEKKEAQAGSEPWVRGYLALLAGDAKHEKLLKGDAPAVRDLREDARVWIPGTLRAGVVARIFQEIAAAPLPASRSEGEAAIERVRALLAEADVPAVVLRHSSIARYAKTALAATAVGLELGEFVHGQLSTTADGVVRLVYEFEDAAEAADFQRHPGYTKEMRAKYPALQRTEAQAQIEVADGQARFLGPMAWRLPLGLQAPFSIRYQFRFVKTEGEMAASPSLDLLVCDDGKESFVRCSEFGWIFAIERTTGRTASSNPPSSVSYYPDTDYTVEMQHDGTRVATRFEGEERATCAVGALRSGGVVFWVHTDQPIVVDHVVIEGRVDPSSIEPARRAWIARELAALGL